MAVLVTGGAGRLGMKVCRALLQDGYQVRVFDLDTKRSRKNIKALEGRVEIVWGDITRAESVRQALEGVDSVVHMAGLLPPVTDQNPELATKVNVGGTRTLVDLIKEKGGGIPIVYTSSIVVFGVTPNPAAPLSPEKNPPNPQEPYAVTKLQCEDLIRESGIDYVVLRMSSAMELDASAIKLMFRLPLNNRFEFCHPDDTILAIVNSVKNMETAKGNTLVIAGGPDERMTYADFIGGALGVLGLPLPPARKFNQEPYCVDWYDTSRSQELLQYQTKAFADFKKDLSRDVFGPFSFLLVPFMRYFVGPVFGRVIVRLL